jgi:hypothetical protein
MTCGSVLENATQLEQCMRLGLGSGLTTKPHLCRLATYVQYVIRPWQLSLDLETFEGRTWKKPGLARRRKVILDALGTK